jgi:hypothetical protein
VRACISSELNSQGAWDQRQMSNLCKQMSNLTGEGPEGLKRIFELFSIGFQTNRAIRLASMMREVRNRGLGLGARMVTGLG